MFNKNVEQRVYIKTFRFKEKKSADASRFNLGSLKKLILNRKIPAEAELEYEIHFVTTKERTTKVQKISLDFKFDAIKYDSVNRKFSRPVLVVTNYTITESGK
jgi:hypothetical protein